MKKYLRFNFVRDVDKHKPNYDKDSVSDMREAIDYYEEAISDYEWLLDTIMSEFRSFVKWINDFIQTENKEEFKERTEQFIDTISSEDFSPRDRSWILSKMFFEVYKDTHPEYYERQRKIKEEEDKKRDDNLNEFKEYFFDFNQ